MEGVFFVIDATSSRRQKNHQKKENQTQSLKKEKEAKIKIERKEGK